MMNNDLTKEEKAAISSLKRLAKKWPESLWLFSASGTLWVMRRGADGTFTKDSSGGVAQELALDSIDIPNDGGDW